LIPGGAGPLGWDTPAAIGVKAAKPERLVVDIVGDYGFGFCGEEMAMAVMYKLPILVIIINNGYLSLIRQQEKYNFNMDFEVQTWYEDNLVNFVKLAEAYGAYAERVEKPDDIKPALQRAINTGKPAIIDIVVERDTDASMGPSLDKINEYEPLPLKAGVL
jgi:tartronate-semialdehyde synthase